MARINRIDSSHNVGKNCKINLITETFAADDIGNQISEITKRSVFGTVASVYGTEFYRAGEEGLKAAKIFTIWSNEYKNEEKLEFETELYAIYRVYERADNRIELYTEKKVGIDG